MDDTPDPSAVDLRAVPLFPLPNVVLFPRAVLPLHIFEERYKAMTADALAGDHQIAMALLRPGWEKSYYAKPEIEPVVCVGTIVSHERLADGKFNFLLQGLVRGRVVRELDAGQPYRLAELQVLRETAVLEIDLESSRKRLVELFTTDLLSKTGLAPQFRKLLASPWSTAQIADLIAFSYFEEPEFKQSLLAEPEVQKRLARIIKRLEMIRAALQPSAAMRPPSMN